MTAKDVTNQKTGLMIAGQTNLNNPEKITLCIDNIN